MADPVINLKDAAYTAVGLAVIGFQRAQVRRHELAKFLDAALDDLNQRLSEADRPSDGRPAQ